MKIYNLILLASISLPNYGSFMEESKKFIISYPFFSVFATGIVASCVTWKISDFFSNRDREHYKKKYKQYKKNASGPDVSGATKTTSPETQLIREINSLKDELKVYKQASAAAEDFFRQHMIYFTQISVISILETVKTKNKEAYDVCIKAIEEQKIDREVRNQR